jgi:hypothetical protein
MVKAPKIFISYCREDGEWLKRLKQHFAPLARNAQLDPWDDSMIKPGSIYRDKIAKAIADADVAVLLVTSAFLASEFIAKNELAPLLAKPHVFWIAVSSSLYEETVIEKYGCANDPEQPLDTLPIPGQNKALVDICKKILKAVQGPQPPPR